MAPSLIGDTYAKDLSQFPSFSGGNSVSTVLYFIIPDDVTVYRLTETTLDKADFDHIAVVDEIVYDDPLWVVSIIDDLREDGCDDAEIVKQLHEIDPKENQAATQTIARFAYDNFYFKLSDGTAAEGKQIRGAFVTPQKAGVGFAGQVYRQLVLMHKHVACDNSQTVFGASLWAVTVRDVVGRVDIYNVAKQEYVEELDEGAKGVNGCVPWDIGKLNPTILGKWGKYPFHPTINHCYYLVLIIST